LGPIVQTGTQGVAALVAERVAARADGTARWQLAEGQAVRQVAKNVALSPKTVWLTSQRYRQGGLERALYERARPGKAAVLDAQHRQRIVALVCGPPPEGRARWTVRLLTEEVVKRKLVPRVGRETIRVLLESHDLKPWREKNVVRGGTG
jgi:transposase